MHVDYRQETGQEQADYKVGNRPIFVCSAGRNPPICWNFWKENRLENFYRMRDGTAPVRAPRDRIDAAPRKKVPILLFPLFNRGKVE
jgi:hypothetical protein